MDRVPWRPDTYYGRTNSSRNESIPGITGPQARSRDIYYQHIFTELGETL